VGPFSDGVSGTTEAKARIRRGLQTRARTRQEERTKGGWAARAEGEKLPLRLPLEVSDCRAVAIDRQERESRNTTYLLSC